MMLVPCFLLVMRWALHETIFYFRSDNVLLNTVITRFFYLRVLFGPLQSTVDYSVFEDYPVLDLL